MLETEHGFISLDQHDIQPGSIRVRLVSISSADDTHHRCGLNPIYDDSDNAWWKACAPPSRIIISEQREGGLVAVLVEPEQVMNRMLLCSPMAHNGDMAPFTSGRYGFDFSTGCVCRVN